jgi:uncharacterized phiE125 gp8 family phage protein
METAMQRVIVTPATLAPAALSELKQWLGISTAQDDGPLSALLSASLEMCEAFTGSMPLVATCEETLPACTGWQSLRTRPVQAITGVWSVSANGTRVALSASAYAIELEPDGSGRVQLLQTAGATAIAVRFTAGMAPDWPSLPEALRHGIVRLAAHQHREREGSGAGALPPSSVAALWRPWRRLRLA